MSTSTARETALDDNWRMADWMWADIRGAFSVTCPYRYEDMRRKALDGFFWCLRSSRPYYHVPAGFGIRPESVSRFSRIQLDRLFIHLETRPPTVWEWVQQASGIRAQGKQWEIEVRATLQCIKEHVRHYPRVRVEQQADLTGRSRTRIGPRPEQCSWCGVRGKAHLYRDNTAKCWSCIICGAEMFDQVYNGLVTDDLVAFHNIETVLGTQRLF